ncbi:MAG: Fic family protein [Bacteroidales bacterium]|nr:Fic family protein [Bacteroidales bacterium]
MNWKETHAAWLALQPLSEKDKDRISRKFTVEFNYNSNHIEGNTLTYGQTELLLLFGKVVGEAQMKDFEEMKASNVGLMMMKEQSALKDTPLTQTFIRQLHQTLLREDYTVYRTLPDGTVTNYVIHAGRYKTRPNSVITRYGDRFEYASPEETSALMTDLVDWYNQVEASGEYDPVELAALFHYRYIRIHPFEDGNGRIARLLVNFILARNGYPMVVVRSRKKKEYLEALHQSDLVVGPVPSDGSHASLREARHFVNWFKKMVNEEVGNDIEFLQIRDANVWWYDGERISFRSTNSGKILNLLMTEPDITIAALSKAIGINTSAIQKHLKSMTDKGYISRREKDGQWDVFIIPSI